MRQLLVLAILVTPGSLSFSQEIPSPDTTDQSKDDIATLIEALNHRNPQIRQEAANRLKDGARESTAALVEAIVDPSSNQLHAARAATILIGRIETLRPDALVEQVPRLKLTDDDREDLQPLVSFVGRSQAEDWRWYLAVTVLDEIQPTLLTRQTSALMSALDSSSPMKQYGALRALFHLSQSGSPGGAKFALLDMLDRQRPALRGLYLRYNLPIAEDLLAHTSDVRVYYDDEVSDFEYRKLHRFYGHDDLLICDVLLALGADFSDIGGHLLTLAGSHNQSVRLHAAQQLVQLGPRGQTAAARTLAGLLSERHGRWLEQLAEEHSRWVAQRERDSDVEAPESFQVFQKLGHATAGTVPAVTRLLSSGDVRIRHLAAEILEHIGATSKR